MTIDPPFLACWCWALVCVWRGLETEKTGWWAGAGIFTALGILAKYTMALFPAAVVGFLLFHRRSEFRRAGICSPARSQAGCRLWSGTPDMTG
jgi:4-amino-4-deoxy-L-arabinose transferase-like glycosyltransferase